MADAKRTIEILLQFKQQGQEAVTAAAEAIKSLNPAAQGAATAIGGLSEASTKAGSDLSQNMKAAGTAGKAAAADVGNSWAKMLDGLRSSAGRESVFKETIDLLVGGGAALGIGFVGTMLDNAVKKAIEIKQQIKEGTLAGGELYLKVGETVPILNGFISTGEGIAELITGAKAEAADFAKEIQKAAQNMDEFVKSTKAARDAIRQMGELRDKFASMLPKDTGTAEAAKAAEDKAMIDAAAEAAKNKIDSAYAKRVDDAQQQMETANDKQRAAQYFSQQLEKDIAGDLKAQAEVLYNRGPLYDRAAAAQEVALSTSDFKNSLAALNTLKGEITAKKAIVDQIASDALDDLRAIRREKNKEEAAQKNIQHEQWMGKLATGADQVRSNAQITFDQQNESLRQAEYNGVVSPHETEQIQAKLQADQVETVRKGLVAIQVAHEEMLASVEKDIDRQIDQAKITYEKDVENWTEALNQKKVTQTEFDAAMIALTKQREEKIHELEFQRQQAQAQVNVTILQSQHQTSAAKLAQIDIETNAAIEALHKQYDQGLISAQQYKEGLDALESQAAEKRLEINGNFVDGMKLGFQKAMDGLQTVAQIGMKVADDIGNSFADAFGQMVTGTKSVGDAFRAMAASILQDIAKIFAKQAIVGGMNQLFGGTNGGGIYASIGSMFGGMFAGLAEGGIVPGPDTGVDYQPVLARGTEVMIRPEITKKPGMTPFLLAVNEGQSPLQALLSTLGGHMPQMQAAPVIAGIQHFAQGGVVAMQGRNTGAAGGVGGAFYPAIVADQATMRKLVGGGGNVLIDFLNENRSRLHLK